MENLPCLYHQKRSASRVQHSLTSAVFLLKEVLSPSLTVSFIRSLSLSKQLELHCILTFLFYIFDEFIVMINAGQRVARRRRQVCSGSVLVLSGPPLGGHNSRIEHNLMFYQVLSINMFIYHLFSWKGSDVVRQVEEGTGRRERKTGAER